MAQDDVQEVKSKFGWVSRLIATVSIGPSQELCAVPGAQF